jgi:hypothetical protein
MPIIRIDMNGLRTTLTAALPAGADVDRVVQGLASAARQRWIRYAQTDLKSSSRDYVQGISEVEIKGRVATIALQGQLPNMIEKGWPQTDLRKTLLGPGSKAKTAKDGSRYNTVPFRHGTPGSGGRNVGTPMPEPIYQYAKKLAPTLSRPMASGKSQTVLYGQRLQPRSGMKAEAFKLLTTKAKPWHSMSIHRGMIREEKMYAKTKQSQYTTFRTISSKVSRGKQHWLHPGIKAHHIAKKVEADLSKMMAEFIAASTRTRGSR